MSNVYETRYGVSFNGRHSFNYYHLLPTAAPYVAPPVVKTFYVDIPGADGSLDLTEVLTGFPTYENRIGEFNFLIFADRDDWYTIYNKVVNDLNGKQAEVILDDDSDFYYKGRLTVDAPTFQKLKGEIKITGVFAAEKYVNGSSSGNDWLWNPFNFENGIAREYYNISVKNSKTVTLIGSGLIVCPKFTLVSGWLKMEVNGVNYTLQSGDNIFLDVLLGQNETIDCHFTGDGVVTITYRMGGTW